jgi:hypothetical protein
MLQKMSHLLMIGAIAMAVVGCGGSGGANPTNGSGTRDNPMEEGETSENMPYDQTPHHKLAFDIKGASILQANKKVIVQEQTARLVDGGSGKLVGGMSKIYRLAKETNETQTSAETNNTDKNASGDVAPTSAKTNLIAIDAEGNDHLAISAGDLAIKVMYSVVSPKTGLVYLALSDQSDQNIDPLQVIAEYNCAIYEVNASNNHYRCLVEGKMLQANEDYYGHMAVSGTHKPIQFDDDGNIYFLATDFNASEGYLNMPNWNPTLYRYTIATDTLTAITKDNVAAERFAILKNGDVVYHRRW